MAEKTRADEQTPMMKQFRTIKETYPDAILLFRCGDFYETYQEDAVEAAKILNITLTRRSSVAGNAAASIEMAGFPFHALDTYLPKLVRSGKRVAICDQLEDPKLTKKLVKRGVTELVTPSLSYSDAGLASKENNYLAAVHFDEKNRLGIALLDLSTGEFIATDAPVETIKTIIANRAPKEVLYCRQKRNVFKEIWGSSRLYTYELDDWVFTPQSATERLLRQFNVQSIKGLGVGSIPLGTVAAGAILHYLDITQHTQTGNIQHLSRIETDAFVWLDPFTLRNLEITVRTHPEAKTLLDVMDQTLTSMGGRMMRHWLTSPLKSVESITERQSVVTFMFRHPQERETIQQCLSCMGDLERLTSKIASGRAMPRHLVEILGILQQIPTLRKLMRESDNEYLKKLCDKLNPCIEERNLIDRIIEKTGLSLQAKKGFIRSGVSEELDELRNISENAKEYLQSIVDREIQRTGINSLKIGFNNVFGYYLEVRNTFKSQVPHEWIRKQTLVNCERYITEELKELEEKILSSNEKQEIIENRIYQQLLERLLPIAQELNTDANILATLDCLLSFTIVAEQNKYVCPEVNDSLKISITEGRHPVIEKQLPFGEKYVSNSIELDNDSQQIIILTGPNMAGKSALLRQTALIVLLAQTGSFVPAESASIGVVDKIFTRVGASDNLSLGESTFMVEMQEASAILNNLSDRSLVLFDELGRGTSTYDGISIAWAIVEYIHENPCHAKTLFATHYHELNEMEKTFKRIRNYNVSVKEVNHKVIFLRKLQRGGSEHSFGINVAKLAGMPPTITKRAEHILKDLEEANRQGDKGKPIEKIGKGMEGYQLSIFSLDDPVLENIRDRLKKIDTDNLTPLQALTTLTEIKSLVGK